MREKETLYTSPRYDRWLSVKLLADEEPAFTESSIRNLIHQAEERKSSKHIIQGNGLAPYIRRVGSKVLIHHGGFRSWIESANSKGDD